jgi:polyketide biosynthesis acyl carrier protein
MSAEEVFRVICDNVKEVLQGLQDHAFSRQDKLVELGANSVDRSEIVMMTLEQLGLKIPLVETVGPSNIGELADLLSSRKQALTSTKKY